MSDAKKIVLIGDSGVGKTSLVKWLMWHRSCDDPVMATIGAGYSTKILNISDKMVKLHIWDTAGQEKYRALVALYYRNSIGCLCVFDVMDRTSFKHVKNWIKGYREVCEKSSIVIVGNKGDHPESSWEVPFHKIKSFAMTEGYSFIITECKTGTNVLLAFEQLVSAIDGCESVPREGFHVEDEKLPPSRCMC